MQVAKWGVNIREENESYCTEGVGAFFLVLDPKLSV